MNWLQLAEDVIAGKVISNDEALAILNSDDDELLKVMDGAFAIRKHYYGKKSKIEYDYEREKWLLSRGLRILFTII